MFISMFNQFLVHFYLLLLLEEIVEKSTSFEFFFVQKLHMFKFLCVKRI